MLYVERMGSGAKLICVRACADAFASMCVFVDKTDSLRSEETNRMRKPNSWIPRFFTQRLNTDKVSERMSEQVSE